MAALKERGIESSACIKSAVCKKAAL